MEAFQSEPGTGLHGDHQEGVVMVEIDEVAGIAVHRCMPAREAEARLAVAQRDGNHVVAFLGLAMSEVGSIDLAHLDPVLQDRIAGAKDRLQQDHLVSVALSKYGVPDDPVLRAAVHCAVDDILAEFRRAGAAHPTLASQATPPLLRRVA